MTTSSQVPVEFQLGRLMMGLWVPQAVHAAAELGIADAIGEGSASASELAAKLQTNPDATARLLDALAVLGLVARAPAGFALTALGAGLRSDSAHSRRAWARLMGGGPVWRAWGQLSECVRSGKPAYSAGAGPRSSDSEVFDAMASDPEAAAIFHRAMCDGTAAVAPEVIAAIDWSNARSVVDVGGGHGELLCAALQANPELRGQVFDLEHARPGANRLLQQRGLAARAGFSAGDLFRSSPPSADVLLLKSVIHDWDDEHSLRILGHCRAALRPGDRLVVIEPPAPDPGAEVPANFAWIVAFSDLNMLVNCGGRERTTSQYRALLERAGLRMRAQRGTGFYSCFECERAG